MLFILLTMALASLDDSNDWFHDTHDNLHHFIEELLENPSKQELELLKYAAQDWGDFQVNLIPEVSRIQQWIKSSCAWSKRRGNY